MARPELPPPEKGAAVTHCFPHPPPPTKSAGQKQNGPERDAPQRRVSPGPWLFTDKGF